MLTALVLVACLGGCGDSPEPVTVSVAVPATQQAATAPTPSDAANAAPAVSAEQAADDTYNVAVPDGYHPVVWVRARHEVDMRTEPGGGQLVERLGRKTEYGSPNVFGVSRQEHGWVGVPTALLPNGRLGWIKLDPKRLATGATEFSIVVDLSDHRAELLKASRPVRTFAVTVGAAESATPTGHFAVTDTFRGGLNAAYGCCALALSATQPNLPSGWLGGNRIAIHGTYGTLGVAASHGCVRAANAEVSKLLDVVPLGTPVIIRS
jgi:lipoprotein-anchoring transpeptidase ErfK/SrfK